MRTSTTLRFAVLLTFVGGFMDAYTYVSRDGVFANAQTGNVILLGIDLAERRWGSALAHCWPILAFVVGIVVAHVLETARLAKTFAHPIRLAMVAQIGVLIVVAALPASFPDPLVTLPVAFVAAIQLGLFRTVGSLNYITIATTGNLMRVTEALYGRFVEHDDEKRKPAGVYGAIVASFAGGAVVGAVLTGWLGTWAALVAAGVLSVAFALFFIDDIAARQSPPVPGDA